MAQRSSEATATASPGDRRFDENLPRMAAEAFALADRYCDSCRNFHALWPYRRVTRMVGAAEAGRSAVETTLADLLGAGRRSVLIAGAADTGQLAMIARAGAGHDLDIVVIDRCRTPLELCRRFADRWSLRVETVQQDLTALAIERRFDIVLAHSLLQFIPAKRRVDFLARVSRSLRPDGRLLLVFNTGRRIEGELLPEYRKLYSRWVIEAMARMGLPLPAAPDQFQARLDAYAQELESREGAFASPEEVDAYLRAGAFVIRSRAEIDMTLAEPFQRFVAKLGKRRHLAVAEPIIPG
jgi:SAM-dependent methyltransferase